MQQVPLVLGPDEELARFIYSKRQFSIDNGLAKPGAFLPKGTALSVAHTTSLADGAIWATGRETLTPQPGRNVLRARGDVSVLAVNKEKLVATRDDETFVRHTLVEGWPALDDKDHEKQLCKDIAAKLSQHARLHVANPPIEFG